MISGRQALASIDQTVSDAHAEIRRVEQEIRTTSDMMVAAQRSELEILRELASLHVDWLAADGVADQLEHADRQVLKLLEQRDQARDALDEEISESERQQAQHEAERRHQAVQLDGAIGVVDEAEATLQKHLDLDPEYREQRETAEEAERKARHASESAERREAELVEKGAAYHNDPLFMYLWQRAYGTPTYRGSGLTRWLDGKVARLVGYGDARANYARLKEIPTRLRAHADHLTALADEEYERLKALDEKAREAEGIPALEAHVDDEQTVLDQIDERIETAESDYQAMLERRAAFAAGGDDHTRAAIDFLAREFERASLGDLRRTTMSTPYPEDDLVVSRLERQEDEQARLQNVLEDLHDLLAKHRDRLRELEALRLDFKRKRYDRAGSVFTNDSIIPVLLGQFLSGLLDKRMLWKVLKEHQRYVPRKSNPRFGSGGLGRGTIWRGGLGDLGDIIGRVGRGGFGGRGGGGGFRTGGGF